MSLSQRLQELRGNLSLYEIEKGTGIHRKDISRYESGKYQPTRPTLKKLAEYFGVSYEELLFLYFDEQYPESEEQEVIYKWASQKLNKK